jgi:sulfate adenylyltransferase
VSNGDPDAMPPVPEFPASSRDWPSWELRPRQVCDLELLMNGAFAPLSGFMVRSDYDTVCSTMRLASGRLWPIPVVLDVTEEFAGSLSAGQPVVLRDAEGSPLAVLTVRDVWKPDRHAEAAAVYGLDDPAHPGVKHLLERTESTYVGGEVRGIRPPRHYDFVHLRATPAELRAEFARLGWRKVVAFQTRNPMHRAHFELTLRAAQEVDANLLVHPVVGMTKAGDLDHYVRVRCYEALMHRYPPHMAKLAVLPLAMRMAGPREAVWHALIRKNHGCTHFIVGRDHAGPGARPDGEPFYEPYAAQELVRAHSAEIGITMVPFRNMVYVEETKSYVPDGEVPAGHRALHLSGTELRQRLASGRELPEWFTFPEVLAELRRSHPPRSRQGFTVFFTGLSGAGKSTVANILLSRFLEMGGRPVTLLDGDIVRKHLSSELGFSKKDRDTNIRRIGFVASEITKNGGIALCAPIAPYDAIRKEVRAMIQPLGGFVLVHVDAPLGVCEQRDRKGLYAKARAGLVEHFTGVSDPYEPPADAELRLRTDELTPEEAAHQVLLHLEREGYIGA